MRAKILTVNRMPPCFRHSMCNLALIAMVLMLCMPVLNRWQQSIGHVHQADDVSAMCTSAASRAALAVHAHDAENGDGIPSPHDHHNHDACGYCTLGTRMLPVLALVLALSPRLSAQHAVALKPAAAPAARTWPAHAPRGPPLLS